MKNRTKSNGRTKNYIGTTNIPKIKSENDPEQNRLMSTVIAVRDRSSKQIEKLDKIKSQLQFYIDAANVVIPLIPDLSHPEYEGLGLIWEDAARQSEVREQQLMTLESSSNSTSGTIQLTSVSLTRIFDNMPYTSINNPILVDKIENFNNVMDRPEIMENVSSLLKLFHLDVAPHEKKSPFELFEEAHKAFEKPVTRNNPIATSLLAMRESINSTIEELLKLRPDKIPTGSSERGKLNSILGQLKKDDISDNTVQELVDQWHEIKDINLSISKRARLSREKWTKNLIRATHWLYSFLISLDPNKLRSSGKT